MYNASHHLPMLDRKFPNSNIIAMYQYYMVKFLADPNLSAEDRRTTIHYILDHKQKFTAPPEDTDDPIINEVNRKLNGNNVDIPRLTVEQLRGWCSEHSLKAPCMNAGDLVPCSAIRVITITLGGIASMVIPQSAMGSIVLPLLRFCFAVEETGHVYGYVQDAVGHFEVLSGYQHRNIDIAAMPLYELSNDLCGLILDDFTSIGQIFFPDGIMKSIS